VKSSKVTSLKHLKITGNCS